MTNIQANVLAKKAKIIAEGSGSATSAKLKRKALNAILGGSNSWVEYMKEFAETPEELARLIPTDGSEIDAGMNDARAYLVSAAPCGTETVTSFDKGVTEILDGTPTL